ncbi:MAG: ABC transporter permease subunit [Flavipsychrobacter sp.]|nr:ABC transporter permease subunit [Flavipsychrobacter sp.]
MKKRSIEEQFFLWLMRFTTASIIMVLSGLLFVIFKKGYHAMSWAMISEEPQGGFYLGAGGGILNAILGSVYLSVGAIILAILVGLPVALAMNVHMVRYKIWVTVIRFLLDTLWGVPSIVYGAFAFGIMVYFHLRASLLAGIITVALLIVPIITRAFDEALRTIPNGLLETTYAIGGTRSEASFVIFFRQALPGLITAVLLALCRGIGDAASVLFTAGYTDHVPQRLTDPTATLPLAIFFQLSSPIPEVKERAYAATLVLTIIILVISILSRIAGRRFKKYVL